VTCSTKETDRKRAQRIADQFELAAHMGRLGALAARQARKVIGAIYEIANREPLPSDTIADYFRRWTKALPTTRVPLFPVHRNQPLETCRGQRCGRPRDYRA
jgi:hypothetical protein